MGAAEEGGWSHVAMRWLGRLTQLVEISLCWTGGMLAGGVVFGWLPASVAAGELAHRLLGPEPSAAPVSEFARMWASSFRRANAVGWPATLALALLAVNMRVLSVGGEPWMPAMLGAVVLVALWLVLAVGYLATLLALPSAEGVGAPRLWRSALVLPLVSPGSSLVWVVCAASLAVVCLALPIVAILAAPGAAAMLTSWLTRRRLLATGVAAA